MTIVRKFETQAEDKRIWQRKSVGFITTFCLVALALVGIWASNTLVSFGEKLDKVALLQEELERENKILENTISKHLSIVNISSQSASLGLSKPKKIEYLP